MRHPGARDGRDARILPKRFWCVTRYQAGPRSLVARRELALASLGPCLSATREGTRGRPHRALCRRAPGPREHAGPSARTDDRVLARSRARAHSQLTAPSPYQPIDPHPNPPSNAQCEAHGVAPHPTRRDVPAVHSLQPPLSPAPPLPSMHTRAHSTPTNPPARRGFGVSRGGLPHHAASGGILAPRGLVAPLVGPQGFG